MRKTVDEGGRCSYFVLMTSEDKTGDRWLRLGDLARREVIVVRCGCRRSVEYPPGFLQRRHRLPSDFLVYDLQFRLRCSHIGEAVSGSRFSTIGRAAIIQSRGWSGWSWRGSKGGFRSCRIPIW